MLNTHRKAFRRAAKELNYSPLPMAADVVDFIHDQVAWEELDFDAPEFESLSFQLEALLTRELYGLLGWDSYESNARRLTQAELKSLAAR